MERSKLQHRVTRTRLNGSKLLEFGVFYCPLWIRRVLVRAQEGQLETRPWLSLRLRIFIFRIGSGLGVSFSPSERQIQY